MLTEFGNLPVFGTATRPIAVCSSAMRILRWCGFGWDAFDSPREDEVTTCNPRETFGYLCQKNVEPSSPERTYEEFPHFALSGYYPLCILSN